MKWKLHPPFLGSAFRVAARRGLIVAMLTIGSAGPSREEASIACTSASLPIDTLICSNKELSILDNLLARIFVEKRAEAGTGFRHLLDGQRRWLRSRSTTCSVPVGKGEPTLQQRDNAAPCLIKLYRERIAILESAGSERAAAKKQTTPAAVGTLEGHTEAISLSSAGALSSFWGIDLDEAFPDWRERRLFLQSVFERDDGRLFARIGVIGADTKSALWDVDLLAKTKTPLQGFDTPPGMKKLETSVSVQMQNGFKVEFYERYSRGTLNECSDPIQEGYSLVTADGTIRKSFFILGLVYAASGKSIGGDCGIVGGRVDASEPKQVNRYVASDRGAVFVLKDGSVLTGILGQSSQRAIWRFTADLDRPVKAENHLIIPIEDYNALFDKEGLFGAQETLKIKLNKM